jgi:acyl-CoA synthetase (NDP forming)
MIHNRDQLKAVSFLLRPKSIAIIGASSDPRKFSGAFLPNLVAAGFEGKIYPVNPKRSEILGFKCYPSVMQIPEDVDLACLVVPSPAIPEIMEECIKKGVKTALIITAGFGETGEEGKRVQIRIVETATKAGMRICGPNCEGVLSQVTPVDLTMFSKSVKPLLGEVAIVTQSGGIGEYLITHMSERGIGISHWISSGNEADLKLSDYVNYLVQDAHTKVISLFVEGIRDVEKFKEVASTAISEKKPIVVFKIGKSEKARTKAASHTGAVAGSDQIYDAFFRQYGIIRAHSLDEIFEISMALAWQPLPKGDGVGVICDSGGMACLTADAAEDVGLRLPNFSEKTLQKLRELLPEGLTIGNPLDLTALAAPADIAKSIEIIGKDKQVDAVVVTITWWSKEILAEVCEEIIKGMSNLDKPVLLTLAVVSIADPEFRELIRRVTGERIPLYIAPEKAVVAMKAMVSYQSFLKEHARKQMKIGDR